MSQWRAKTKNNCNVIPMRNSNILKRNVILTSSKYVFRSKKKRNCDVIKMCQNDGQELNLAATLSQYVMLTYHKNSNPKTRIQHAK